MKSIEIQGITGCTYPIYVFVSDIYKNYQSLLGIISSNPYPSTITYNTNIPTIFDTADELLLSLIDSNGVEHLKTLQCEGESFLQIRLKRNISTDDFLYENTAIKIETDNTEDKKIEKSNLIYKILEEKTFNGILVQVIEIFDKNTMNQSNKVRLVLNKLTKDLIGWEMVNESGTSFSYILNKISL
jgi:hypothetical protein